MHGRTAAAKNDRHPGKTFPHKAGKGDALYTRQFLIRNDESRMHPLLEQGQRRFRISGGDDGKPHLVQQLFKKIEYARIIVHNEDFPGCAAGRRGAGGGPWGNRFQPAAGWNRRAIPFRRCRLLCQHHPVRERENHAARIRKRGPRRRDGWPRAPLPGYAGRGCGLAQAPRPLPPFSCFVVKKGSQK